MILMEQPSDHLVPHRVITETTLLEHTVAFLQVTHRYS
jgi:hypothetical protein